MSFKTGVFVANEPPKAACWPFGIKTKNQTPEFEKVIEVAPAFVHEADET